MRVHSERSTLRDQEHDVLWFLGGQRIIAALGEQLKGVFRLTELATPAGTVTAALKHLSDEALYVLAGEATIACGGQDFPVRAGTFLFLPCHVPYQMAVSTSGPLSYLTWMTPAGFAQHVTQLGNLNTPLLLAPPLAGESTKIQRLADLLRASTAYLII